MTTRKPDAIPGDAAPTMTYQPGDRVALEHTADPHTLLRPGDEGTVRRYDPQTRVLDVDWDNGSRLSLLLGEGDRLRRTADTGPDRDWERVLDALRSAGETAGRDAATRWAQHVLGGRADGDVAAAAREVLTGFDDIDPPILDQIPTADRYFLADDSDRYAEHAPPDAPAWETLTARQCDQTRWAWCDGYDAAAHAEAARRCRTVLHPDGDDRDLRHVYPDRVRLGGPGVFAGDWAWAPNDAGDMRIPVGFVGTLIDTWNGWAVFCCARDVAEAIVADQHNHRDRLRRHLTAEGIPEADLDRRVDESLGRMWFDGDVIVDDTRVQNDPDAIDHIPPTFDGQYVVMGWCWTWIAVHPYDCDRIAGTIPDPPATASTPRGSSRGHHLGPKPT
ncbi:DUF4314 domain-containing protein [Micromonospora avicenniae]|uniref:DUF4314 domain-containing protein n=1 Tax=Micromonospora avicenniae TaxID=1198245 RepID=A0A1N7FNA2_9ACTN|nr:DUF4314 domain-containing protein [Micromonospora avicenniae]SIS01839.1 protein of unknown function [Micromonospora avicenniae]